VVRIDFDTKDLERKFKRIEREHLPAITAQAVNRTAEYVRDVLTAEVQRTFHAPVPFTQRAVMLTRYASKRGPFQRDVFLRDEATKGTPPVKYLGPEVYGGPRRAKRFERALRAVGALTDSEYAYPARSFKLNAAGNIPAGTITRILSQLRASPDPTQNVTTRSKRRGKARKRVGYFAAKAGSGLHPGVYQRVAPGLLQPVLVFSSRTPRYERRFDFKRIAAQAYLREYVDRWRLAANMRLGRDV
jgi:hypothetical protein